MNGVNGKRLGHSYGFNAISHKAHTINEIQPTLEAVLDKTSFSSNSEMDALVIHCGVNDIKNSDPNNASKKLANCIKNVAAVYPRTKIVVSKIAPVRDSELDVKRDLFNALLSSELHNVENVSLANHSNLQTHTGVLRDGLHPTRRGSSVLAVNIGRQVCQLFWKIPQTATTRHKKHFDQRKKLQQFEVGSKVLMLCPTKANNLKLEWQGPYVVTERVGQADYKIEVRGKERLYHASLLKQFIEKDAGGAVATVVIDDTQPEWENTATTTRDIPVIPLESKLRGKYSG
ncbi:hypothetical protein ACOMHN_062554 [Nucella lapillus]